MTPFGTSDLTAMLADFGVPIVWGVVTGKGIEDKADEEYLTNGPDRFTGTERSVRLETERFSGLGQGERITVDGVAFEVISAHREGDGAITHVLCMPV